MILTEILVFSACILLGFGGWRVGRQYGYSQGWFDGHQHATMKILPSSHVRVVESVYDHEKAGM